MSVVFIAGAGTDIGKTHIACGLIAALRGRGAAVDALKPVLSGFDVAEAAQSDAGRLLEALGRAPTLEEIAHISPWRFAAPLAANMAARAEGKAIDFAAIAALCSARAAAARGVLLIEGAGGVMSPLSDETTFLDLTAALQASSVLVCGSYLGAISHALTALAALRARGLAIVALVVSESSAPAIDLTETAQTLARLAGATPVLVSPRADGVAFAHAMTCLAALIDHGMPA